MSGGVSISLRVKTEKSLPNMNSCWTKRGFRNQEIYICGYDFRRKNENVVMCGINVAIYRFQTHSINMATQCNEINPTKAANANLID